MESSSRPRADRPAWSPSNRDRRGCAVSSWRISGGNGLLLTRALARMANQRDGARLLLLRERRELHAVEESEDGRVELFPKVVRHAALVPVAILAAAALRRVERLLDGLDDVGDRDAARVAREGVAAAGAAHAFDEAAAAQLAEELLE